MYGLYRSITSMVAPLMPYWLERRRGQGKEDGSRLQERFGKASIARPKGKLVWVHAASVGESNAALPLIRALLTTYPAIHVLLTTGTVTAAQQVMGRLPEGAMHQFAPVDTPKAVNAFVEHWHPQVALFVDSELWPNLIIKARARGAVMGMVNARMSETSYRKWKLVRPFICRILQQFTYCFAQSVEDAERLTALGMEKIDHIGNLKYDVPPLAVDATELAKLREQIGNRVVFLAASTHAGEEEQLGDVHHDLQEEFPDVLTIIVPRHPERASEIMSLLKDYSIARRSLKHPIFPETDIYLADTFGELGLFYTLAKVAFIGNSLVRNGGHNPIEALQLRCPVVLGPNMDNFRHVAHVIERAGACIRVHDNRMLAGAVASILSDEVLREDMAVAGYKHVHSNGGTLMTIVNSLQANLAV